MSKHEAKRLHASLRPFYQFILVIACLGLLASCGGGGDSNQSSSGNAVITTNEDFARYSATIDPKMLSNRAKQELANGKSINQIISTVANQYWIAGNMPNDEVIKIVNKFPGFRVIASIELLGVLVETTDANALVSLKGIRQTSGIFSVLQRVWVGKDSGTFASNIIPNDGSLLGDNDGDNWHIDFLRLPEAWSLSTGSDQIVVGVVDGGFDASEHTEMQSRILFNFTDTSNLATDRQHGSLVSSAIVANTDNGIGMSGINWISKISISNWSDENNTPQAYRRAYQAAENIPVVNNSWSFSGKCENFILGQGCPTADDAFHLAPIFRNIIAGEVRAQHTLHVWSASNNGRNAITGTGSLQYSVDPLVPEEQRAGTAIFSPLPNLLIVAALRKDGNLAPYSNFGESVEIAAPAEYKAAYGDSSYETLNNGFIFDGSTADYGNDKGFNGTSAAAPLISGIASLVFSRNTNLAPGDVKKILIQTSDRSVRQRHTVVGTIVTLPGGQIIPIANAAKAVQSAVKTNITSLDIVTANPTPGTTTNFTLHTDPTTAPAQKVEVSIPGNPWADVFNQANGIRDASGVFQSEIYQFAVSYVFPSAGTQDIYIRTTDLLGRTTTYTRQVTITGLPPSSSIAQTALTNGLYLKFSGDNCYEKVSLGANTAPNEYVMNRAKYCLQSGAWVLEPFSPRHIMLSNGSWVSFFNNLKAVFVPSSPITLKVGGEAFFSFTVSLSSSSGPVSAERVIYDLSLNNTADTYQIEYDSSTNGVGGFDSIPQLLTSYPVSLNGLSLLNRGQYGWAFEYVGGEPTNHVRFYDASQAPIVVSGVERRPVLASNLWNRLSFTGGNEILVLETPSGFEPFMRLISGEKVIYAKRTADSYVREGVYAAPGTSRVWQYKNKTAVDAEMNAGGFPNTVN